MNSVRRRALPLLSALLVVGGLQGLGAAPAVADEVYPRPADGTMEFNGHGWGHGRGLSQYGAYGAARGGRSWQQIVDFYYAGATRGSIGNPTVRVGVAGTLGATARAKAVSGLRVTYGPDRTGATPLHTQTGDGKAISYWFAGPPSAGEATGRLYLRARLADGTTRTVTSPSTTRINFTNPSTGSVLAVAGSTTQTYRGELRAHLVNGAVSPVVALPMDTYLRGVVPNESPASWPAAALGAQAVAARSYTAYALDHPRTSTYDICDTISCQVFKGSGEQPSTDAAITATAGIVMMYAGQPAFTEFSSSNGGWTAGSDKPYMTAKQDPYEAASGNPYANWTISLPVTSFESRWPGIGSFQSLRIVTRNGHGEWGGRVLTAVVVGSQGSVTTTGEAIRGLGLRSSWFKPVVPASARSFPRDLTGDGKADLVAVDAATGHLRLSAGSGASSFGAPTTVNTSDWRVMRKVFTAGAWDTDRLSDVMAVWPDGTLWAYAARSGGGLASGVKVGSGWGVFDAVFPVGDFDGDRCTDVLARRSDNGELWLYRSDCAGTFVAKRKVGTGWGPFTAVLSPGDVTGDGKADVLARTSAGVLRLYPGNGRGGWLTARNVSSGWQVYDTIVSPGDLDGDGRSELVVRGTDGTLYQYRSTGSGTFHPRQQIGTGWQTSATILP